MTEQTQDSTAGPPVTTGPRRSIGFIPEAEAALTELHERFGLNKTDLVNRAVQLYAVVSRRDRIVLMDRDGGNSAEVVLR